ncbi:hypothetical protein NSK_005166 [Nannochloropsis salina CCMP1776]|uniref:Magnesium transporter n=1 Tax=Nannochloropsis salina CCMP1776 TaxID=1027361 RepID=A0A4D9D4P2_9STRA|nr:hypothetical protein NSK_005166 [Nannochloropsis salina CCMP1776]|eukprot:TFJ83519.1 hypothetical protein NSK_005166 [Nannochloropsis salina CCMP1776]
MRRKLKALHSDVNLLLLWLSPLSTVVTRLQAELPTGPDVELKKHLEDLGDHVHGEGEGGREGASEGEAEGAMLTQVTVMCLPAQFLTGVFGMNFEHFPLLKSPDGFLIFWLMTGTAIVVIMVVFRLKSWM